MRDKRASGNANKIESREAPGVRIILFQQDVMTVNSMERRKTFT